MSDEIHKNYFDQLPVIYKDGSEYIGSWKDGKRHGQGTWTHPNGQKYVGEYKDDKRHGQGTFSYPNGKKYVSEWEDDMPHGEGTLTFRDGRKYAGMFKEGKLHGHGALIHSNGHKYVGEWKDGQLQELHWEGNLSSYEVTLTNHNIPVERKIIMAEAEPIIPGEAWTEPFTCMEFVWVPGGTFEMGDILGNGEDNEKPVHTVELDGIWMGKYPVTQAQWEKVMGNNPSGFKGPSNPVENISWEEAQEFIKKMHPPSNALSYRLPTEAEWEYSCRSGGKHEMYCGGNDVGKLAWYRVNSDGKTHPVGLKSPNALDIYDMSGNVWEWCHDWFDENYYAQSPRNNPQGSHKPHGPPEFRGNLMERVVRGGNRESDARCCRAAYRHLSPSWLKLVDTGFRLVLAPDPMYATLTKKAVQGEVVVVKTTQESIPEAKPETTSVVRADTGQEGLNTSLAVNENSQELEAKAEAFVAEFRAKLIEEKITNQAQKPSLSRGLKQCGKGLTGMGRAGVDLIVAVVKLGWNFLSRQK